eukprot:g21036.t2
MAGCDIQLLPRLCCLGSSDFKWNQCSFNLNESKMSTARLVSFLQLRVQRAYVVEASFAGSGESVRRDVEAEASDTDPGEEGEAVEGAAMFEGSQGVVQEAATLLLQQLVPQRHWCNAQGDTVMLDQDVESCSARSPGNLLRVRLTAA